MSSLRKDGDFVLDRNSHLGRHSIKLAMLGRAPGGSLAWDDGPLKTRGAFTGIDKDDWEWNHEWGRWVLNFASGDNHVDFGMYPVLGQDPFTIMGLCAPDSAGTWDGPIIGWGDTGTDHDYFELNVDGTGFVHGNQAGTGNTSTFSGAMTADVLQSFLYVHYGGTNCNGDRLWIDGKEATGGGTGTTVLDIEAGGDHARVGASNATGIFNVIGKIGDLIVFGAELGEPEAGIIANRHDPTLGGLLIPRPPANTFDLEGVR